MHHFSIRDVENMSGIKAHTMRMWEQRYGLFLSKRKQSLHRYYDNEDLKTILRIAYLYHNGYRISKIARLSEEEIIRLASTSFGNDEYEVLVNQLTEACLEYKTEAFENTLNAAQQGMGLQKCIEKVVYPFLDKIGLLWMTNHVLPAQEHFCSYLIEKMIYCAIQQLPAVKDNEDKCYVLFAPEGETHEIPVLLVQYLVKEQGLKAVFLGRDISISALETFCRHQPVSHLYFHLIIDFIPGGAAAFIEKLCSTFSDKKIIASGPALKEIQQVPANMQLLRSLQALNEHNWAV